ATCMNCHRQIWSDAPMLEPVRESFRSDKPLEWVRVHDLPDFAYFNHSIHVAKGVGCTTCHGAVDRMPLMWQTAPLTMGGCAGCHRPPTRTPRPKRGFSTAGGAPPPTQRARGEEPARVHHTPPPQNCSTCHR